MQPYAPIDRDTAPRFLAIADEATRRAWCATEGHADDPIICRVVGRIIPGRPVECSRVEQCRRCRAVRVVKDQGHVGPWLDAAAA